MWFFFFFFSTGLRPRDVRSVDPSLFLTNSMPSLLVSMLVNEIMQDWHFLINIIFLLFVVKLLIILYESSLLIFFSS